MGIPSALSGGNNIFGKGLIDLTRRSFFDWMDAISANMMLPLGGLLIAIYTAYLMDRDRRQSEFMEGTTWSRLYGPWLVVLRYLVPIAVLVVLVQGLMKLFAV